MNNLFRHLQLCTLLGWFVFMSTDPQEDRKTYTGYVFCAWWFGRLPEGGKSYYIDQIEILKPISRPEIKKIGHSRKTFLFRELCA